MAVYKVPQDVEADDKLIGPFSFRQFVYLIVVAMAGAIGWGLWQILPPLSILVSPIIIFFGALALPLRKDQPMEIYMAAIISYYTKPRKRLWQPDGIESLVEVTAPRTVDIKRTKDFNQYEAEKRLTYLANIVDSRGWAVRGVGVAHPNTAMNTDVFFAAQQAEDVLDETHMVAETFDQMIKKSDARRHQDVLARMRQPTPSAPQSPAEPATTANNPFDYTPPDPYLNLENQFIQKPDSAATPNKDDVEYNPYPDNIHQSVVQPLEQENQLIEEGITQPQPEETPSIQIPEKEPESTSEKTISPDIINLINATGLSVETLAREANRIQMKETQLTEGNEVVINLH